MDNYPELLFYLAAVGGGFLLGLFCAADSKQVREMSEAMDAIRANDYLYTDPNQIMTWHKSRIRRAPKSRIYWRTLYLDYLAYATDAGVYTVAPLQNVREYLEARGVKSGVAKKGEFAVGVRLA